jgi:ribosomal protein L16 Arg81 hydroxylase
LLNISPDDFFETIWEQQPRLALNACEDDLEQILTIDQFDVIINSNSHGLNIVEGKMARPVITGESNSFSSQYLYEAYARGCTILQSGIQRYCLPIADICRQIELEILNAGIGLSEAIGANVYLTPPGSQGFDIHYDNHCVLVVQLSGTKKWNVFNPLDKLPVARCTKSIAIEQLDRPLMDVTLQPGDVLYIPRGFPHFAVCNEQSSLHLTLSIRTITWADVIYGACLDDASFRKSVRQNTRNGSSSQKHYEEKLISRLTQMKVEDFISNRRIENRSMLHPLPHSRISSLDKIKTIDINSTVTRQPLVECEVIIKGDKALLAFCGGLLQLPVSMKPVLEFIAKRNEFSPGELPSIYDHYDPVELTRLLVRKGLVYPKITADSLKAISY